MTKKKYPKGSEWRKWDLHVHTPSSVVQNYGGDTPQNWEKFITDLESLPSEFKVLGINDYLFLDGYRKVLDYKTKGRLQNIDLLLPVLEFRIDAFAGTEEKLKRINVHVIFSDHLTADQIQSQFLSALTTHVKLVPDSNQSSWAGVIDRKSVEDLGKVIRESTPPEKQATISDLQLGFNNLCVNIDDLKKKLRENTYLKDNFLLAVGKTEWAAIQWTGASIATKKTIICDADFVFTSAETPEAANTAREALQKHGVNRKVLDCSDAHSFKDATVKDRIGKCFTWIKGDPTFKALKYAAIEYDQRVFIGTEPSKRKKLRMESTKFIKKLEVRKKNGSSLTETWFDFETPLNPDLVAVIGNKGNGKSAFVEVVGLSGNTRNDAHFLFLHGNKFRHPKNDKSSHFEAILTMEDDQAYRRTLSEASNPDDIERVKLLPQSLLEKICNDISKDEETDFDKELKEIIFSHVPERDRLNQANMNELIGLKTKETYAQIEHLKQNLKTKNKTLIETEEKRLDSYKSRLESQLAQKQNELQAHDNAKPPAVVKPDMDPQTQEKLIGIVDEIAKLENEKNELNKSIEAATKEQKNIAIKTEKISSLSMKLVSAHALLEKTKTEITALASELGIVESIFEYSLSRKHVDILKDSILKEKEAVEKVLDLNNSEGLPDKLDKIEQQLIKKRAECDEPTKKYQVYLDELKAWENKRSELVGDKTKIDSLEYFRSLISEISEVPERIDQLRSQRNNTTKEIYRCIKSLADTYKTLYKPVQDFVSSHEIVAGKLNLAFDVSIIPSSFKHNFLEYIDKSISGNFYGKENAEKLVDEILNSGDFETEAGLMQFLEKVQSKLDIDQKDNNASVAKQLRKGVSVIDLYSYLYSLDFLLPKYTMKLGEKDVSQLSPGEKGTLLLVFYLLVDKRDLPLIIDQPEDNLDNQTVFDILVPSIKEAKKHRQIIMVTHNPNLAVVCDAEQIIHASIDKSAGYKVEYRSGSIENPEIKKQIIDILEGTMPAFANRSDKYDD